MGYYIGKIVDTSFEKTVDKLTEELKKVGFGVVSEINMQEKLKEKLNVDFRKYLIIGACNPPFAYEALQVEDKIGTMLPCNIIIQETDDGKTEVAAIDPIASMVAVRNEKLADLGSNVRNKLQVVIDAL